MKPGQRLVRFHSERELKWPSFAQLHYSARPSFLATSRARWQPILGITTEARSRTEATRLTRLRSARTTFASMALGHSTMSMTSRSLIRILATQQRLRRHHFRISEVALTTAGALAAVSAVNSVTGSVVISLWNIADLPIWAALVRLTLAANSWKRIPNSMALLASPTSTMTLTAAAG